MGTTSNRSWPYPESSDYVADGATAIENLADAIDGSIGKGFAYVQTVTFSSSGTFTKASYPWLSKVRVMLVGGGGGGGSIVDSSGFTRGYGGGGGGGGYSEKWIDVASLGTSETVTIGAGGAGGASGGANNGTDGGTTSFGSHCVATGGLGGIAVNNAAGTKRPAAGGRASNGDINAKGENGGQPGRGGVDDNYGQGYGGSSRFGEGGDNDQGYNVNASGQDGNVGSGGAGGYAGLSFTTTGTPGGDGGDGYVIVELYA